MSWLKKKIPGRKNEHGRDMLVLIKASDWVAPSTQDILELIEDILNNDDVVYPKRKGFKGSGVFISQLLDVCARHLA